MARRQLLGVCGASGATALWITLAQGCGRVDLDGDAGADAGADGFTAEKDVVTFPDDASSPTDAPSECTTPRSRCGAACVDTSSDRSHCGGCGRACASTDVCAAGTCQLSCAATLTRCTAGDAGDAGDGGGTSYCANLTTSNDDCGACGKHCPSYARCTGGTCLVDPLTGAGTSADPYTLEDGLASCKVYKAAYGAAALDGYYRVNPTDVVGAAFDVYCDQTQSGGGWSRCVEFINTAADDGDPNLLDRCVEWSNAAWQTGELLVDVRDEANALLYSSSGRRTGTWTNDHITSTLGNQWQVDTHDRFVPLANTDRLYIFGKSAAQAGCYGALGNGYGIAIYPNTGPSGYSNIKFLVMSYRMYRTGSNPNNPRAFVGWTESHEICGDAAATMATCGAPGVGPAILGKFEFFLR